jgi:predicted unusual protein kinase regulating ubiquinone biosynthesis (AarF/ABC1/UbiB family)
MRIRIGNCLKLNDGRLGLIDYGQTRRIDIDQRVKFAQVVVALNGNRKPGRIAPYTFASHNSSTVARAMREAGFATRNNDDDEVMMQYAKLLFDSDEESQARGFVIPQVLSVSRCANSRPSRRAYVRGSIVFNQQEYFKSLMEENPLVTIPDSASA